MQPHALIRSAGLAAILGGAARIASALPLGLAPVSLEALYAVIDILLVFGLIGIYLVRAEALGFLGFAAFAVAMAGFSFIGGPDADPFGFSTYEQGAAIIAIALVGLSIAWLSRRQRPLAPPLLWFASVVAVGVLSALPAPMPDYGFTIAGLCFGAAFIAGGLDLLRRPVAASAPPLA